MVRFFEQFLNKVRALNGTCASEDIFKSVFTYILYIIAIIIGLNAEKR